MENNDCGVELPIELETQKDGNCFFHAVFGDNVSGVFQTLRATEMRKEWHDFLCQFTSLSDKNMPRFLQEQLKKVFNIFFLGNPESVTESLCSIYELVGNGKLAIVEAETKVEKLVQDMAEKFLKEETFRGSTFNIISKARSEQVADKPSINDLLHDGNRQLLKNEIKNDLKNCALCYLNISKEQYDKEYNSEFIANSLFESTGFYRSYLEAIQGRTYFILIEEIPIIASLANIEVEVYYEDNLGKTKLLLYHPNKELVLSWRTNYVWSRPAKTREIIIHKTNHFSRARLVPLRTQNNDEISNDSFGDNLRTPINCETMNNESSSFLESYAFKLDVDRQSSTGIVVDVKCQNGSHVMDQLPDPSCFKSHNFTRNLNDQPHSNDPIFHDDFSRISIPSTHVDYFNKENNLESFYSMEQNQSLSTDFDVCSKHTQKCANCSGQNDLGEIELEILEIPNPSIFKVRKFTSKPNRVVKEINKKTGVFYLGSLDAKKQMSGPGKLSSKDEKQFIEGEWKNNYLAKVISCQFVNSSGMDSDGYARIYGRDRLFTLDKDSFVARVNIGYLEELNFSKPDLTFRDIKRMVFEKIKFEKILEDQKLCVVEGTYSDFKQLLQERSGKTAYGLEYAEDLVQLCVTLENNRELEKGKSFSDSATTILSKLLINKNISPELKNATERVFGAVASLNTRNETILQTNMFPRPYLSHPKDLLEVLKLISDEGIEHHRNALINKCNSNAILSVMEDCLKNKLSSIKLLCLSGQDIQLFSDLISATNEQKYLTDEAKADVIPLLLKFVEHLWDILIQHTEQDRSKIFSIRNVAPLTNLVYLSLYKHFVEIITEICSEAKICLRNLLVINWGKWALAGSAITWPTPSHKNHFLERQLHFIFTLLEHFKPCHYQNRKKFQYCLKLFKDERTMLSKVKDFIVGNEHVEANITAGLSEEQLIWLYILDDAMANIIQHQKKELKLTKESEEQMKKVVLLLLEAYSEYIKQENYRFESFRAAARNIIKFVVHVSPYFYKASGDLDHSILLKQISFIGANISQKYCDLSVCFYSLINVFNKYWECRELMLANISDTLPYEYFKSHIEEVSKKILEVVDIALDQKVNPQVLSSYFRMIDEFVKHLKAVDFAWIVKKDFCINGLLSNNVLKSIDDDKQSYLVLKPIEFIKYCESNGKNIPTHYTIEIVKTLLATISSSLLKTDLDIEINMNATNKLILAIGHSFIHFKDQSNYVDFDQFLSDSTQPFNTVLENRSSYQDFEKRIDNIETFYIYIRKQDEIDITKALNLFQSEAERLQDIGFNTSFNPKILLSCYEKYIEQFNSYIEKTSNNECNIHIIIEDVNEILKSMDIVDINKMTPDLKENTLPLLLAGLSAVWSIQNSKDITSTGKSLKLHCIQILCILRLLSVDQMSNGMGKHLAQILTGQGKSVVLGILATILALLGSPVRVVCYSQYLADRDQQDFNDFFSKFNVTKNIVYGTFYEMASEILSPEICGYKQDSGTLVEKCILNQLGKQTKGKSTVQFSIGSVLLIDEVDIFFTDQFYGNTYNSAAIIGMVALTEIQTRIWETVTSGMHQHDFVVRVIDGLIQKIVGSNKDDGFSTFLSTTEFMFKKHLDIMIDNAVHVATGSAECWYIRDYKLTEDGMVSYRGYDGLYYTNKYCQYFNIFNYFRLKEKDYDHKNFSNFGYFMISCGSVSYANLPKEYSIISGVSGTLTNLNGPEKDAIKSYDMKNISSMPSFFGRNKLVFNEKEHFTLQNLEESWYTTIYNHVSATIQSGRSVLVFFETEFIIDKFKKKFERNIACLRVLTGNEELSQLDWIINEAGVAQTVTLATRLMGRGVDFKSNDSSVEAKGGVHVIQTFFSLDEKEEIQIKGRTARKSNRGSYELILCEMHLQQYNLITGSHNSYQDLCHGRKTKAEEKSEKNAKSIPLLFF